MASTTVSYPPLKMWIGPTGKSRWGQKVYESESYTQPWDGRMGSREAADGVYFIVVRAGNSDVPETVFARGSLHLMR
jgi:hypothetical protein